MRAFLISLGLFLITVMTFLWIGPYFVDWSSYRNSFSSALGEFTQRKIDVKGDLVVRILPTPAVEVSDVFVGEYLNQEDGSNNGVTNENNPYLLSFDTLTVTLELGALLRGELRATSATMNEPVLRIARGRDGKENWHTKLNPQSNLAFFDELVIEGLRY